MYSGAIVVNTALFAVSLFALNSMSFAVLNVVSGALCWVGYYRTKEDGNNSGN